MSGFSAATVAPLSYDFTSFPKDGSDGERCTGKSLIPEPSKAKIEEFFRSLAEDFNLDVVGTAPSEEEMEAALEARAEKTLELLSAVCSGKPSVDELKQLPPRILTLFAIYLRENLLPKA